MGFFFPPPKNPPKTNRRSWFQGEKGLLGWKRNNNIYIQIIHFLGFQEHKQWGQRMNKTIDSGHKQVPNISDKIIHTNMSRSFRKQSDKNRFQLLVLNILNLWCKKVARGVLSWWFAWGSYHYPYRKLKEFS